MHRRGSIATLITGEHSPSSPSAPTLLSCCTVKSRVNAKSLVHPSSSHYFILEVTFKADSVDVRKFQLACRER